MSFLYVDSLDEETGVTRRLPISTAFFVSVDLLPDSAPNNYAALYVVTARHVVDGSETLYLRVRIRDGNVVDIPVAPDGWHQHPSTDVAVASFTGDRLDALDITHIPTDVFATQEFTTEHGVGEGDDVFFSGLFVGHAGEQAPLPVLRFGRIALTPREPVSIEISKRPRTRAQVDAYLVEAIAWGGQSGSPAFLSLGPDRHMGNLVVGGAPPFALLGLVQGSWRTERLGTATAPDPGGDGVAGINLGIAVVVPAYKIMELLMDEDLRAQRLEMIESARSVHSQTIQQPDAEQLASELDASASDAS